MMRTSLVFSAAMATGFAALAPRPAQADCAGPQTAAAPRAGEVVPESPVLHVFVPSWLDRKDRAPLEVVAGGGNVLDVDARRVSQSGAFVTYRLAVKTGGARQITVRSGDSELATYRVDPNWERPSEPFAVATPERLVDAWSCSHDNAWILTLSPAPAYRVRWAGGGEAGTVVVPRDYSDMFSPGDDGAGRIGLGHLSCLGETIPEKAAEGRLEVGVSPIYADGTVGPTWSTVLGVVDEPAPAPDLAPPVVTSVELGEPPATEQPALQPAQTDRSPRPYTAWLIAAGLFALGFAITARAIRGRRDLAPRLERWLDRSVPQLILVVSAATALVASANVASLAGCPAVASAWIAAITAGCVAALVHRAPRA